jgi:hypothetical protein
VGAMGAIFPIALLVNFCDYNYFRDRATYNPSLATAVNYTVANAGDAPLTLIYGPSFFTLASKINGDVTIGLNRRLNNQSNTLAAAVKAKSTMSNLFAIELGNEPECAPVFFILVCHSKSNLP